MIIQKTKGNKGMTQDLYTTTPSLKSNQMKLGSLPCHTEGVDILKSNGTWASSSREYMPAAIKGKPSQASSRLKLDVVCLPHTKHRCR